VALLAAGLFRYGIGLQHDGPLPRGTPSVILAGLVLLTLSSWLLIGRNPERVRFWFKALGEKWDLGSSSFLLLPDDDESVQLLSEAALLAGMPEASGLSPGGEPDDTEESPQDEPSSEAEATPAHPPAANATVREHLYAYNQLSRAVDSLAQRNLIRSAEIHVGKLLFIGGVTCFLAAVALMLYNGVGGGRTVPAPTAYQAPGPQN
jgi:hypothetical protein